MKKFLMIFGGVVLALIVLIVVLVVFVFSTSDKLVCKSDQGNITLYYKKDKITGYTANGITYDMDQQNEVAKQLGMDNYISEFKVWFESNTTGTCE